MEDYSYAHNLGRDELPPGELTWETYYQVPFSVKFMAHEKYTLLYERPTRSFKRAAWDRLLVMCKEKGHGDVFYVTYYPRLKLFIGNLADINTLAHTRSYLYKGELIHGR